MANYTRDKIIAKCVYRTSKKDGKQSTFPILTAILKKQRFSVIPLKEVRTKFPFIEKPVDGKRYVLVNPVYFYDHTTIYNVIKVVSADDIHEFSDDDIEIIKEED